MTLVAGHIISDQIANFEPNIIFIIFKKLTKEVIKETRLNSKSFSVVFNELLDQDDFIGIYLLI